ncbi:hypothetical protein N1851_012832 [Merluccius polli]|uniref:Uncharacterized protein n=1 Tax=Merluccius polli TaxID=89951 RepID=A0AA47MVX4_MERPO|nr:hypothetical protein N1851_012832 [Merluccius polli]
MLRWPALLEVSEVSVLCSHSYKYFEPFKYNSLQRFCILAPTVDTLTHATLGIYVLKEHASEELEDIGIVLECMKVLRDQENKAFVARKLFGLLYALDLMYPSDLCYTFETIQKVFMELDSSTLSNKLQSQKTDYLSEILLLRFIVWGELRNWLLLAIPTIHARAKTCKSVTPVPPPVLRWDMCARTDTGRTPPT